MKLSRRMLSLPPYLSTPWKNVVAMRVKLQPEAEQPTLIVQLTDGTSVEVPGVTPQLVHQIFAAHAEAVESETGGAPLMSNGPLPEQLLGVPFRVGPGGIEQVGSMLQHDRNQADAPDLPPEVLAKVAGIAQVLGAENADSLPQSEAGCNCFHCQIARAINRGADINREHAADGDEISEEDLRFRSWDIELAEGSQDVYNVTNPEDKQERYTVHLGQSLGCTCGEKNCIHIRAVLKT